MVLGRLRGPHASAGARLARDRTRRLDADPRADRQRQDADGISVVPGPADVHAGAAKAGRCRVLYVSPLKALAVDVERNLRAPLAGIAQVADGSGDAYIAPAIAIRTGDTPQSERARFQREPADILITTPESLYLLLTSNAREALRSVRHDHRRRDPRPGPDQARGPPGALARTARGALRAAAAAHRSVGDAAPARRSRAVPGRSRHDSQFTIQQANPQSASHNPQSPRPTTRSNRNSPLPEPSATARSPSSTPDSGSRCS